MITQHQQITRTLQLLDVARASASTFEIESAKAEISKMAGNSSDLQMRHFLESSEGLLQSYALRQPNDRKMTILENNFHQIRQTAKGLLESE